MRNLKKFLALVLAMMMAMSLMVTANAASTRYTDEVDVNPDYLEAVTVLTSLDVLKGYGSSTVMAPKATLTRGQFAVMLYRMVTGDVTGARQSAYVGWGGGFSDTTPGAYYDGALDFIQHEGIMVGNAGKFGPDVPISSVDAVVSLLRALNYHNYNDYTGAGYQMNAIIDAERLGLTDVVEARNLTTTASTREVAAQLIFNALLYTENKQTKYWVKDLPGGKLHEFESELNATIYYNTVGKANAEWIGGQTTYTGSLADLKFNGLTKTEGTDKLERPTNKWIDKSDLIVAEFVKPADLSFNGNLTAKTAKDAAKALDATPGDLLAVSYYNGEKATDDTPAWREDTGSATTARAAGTKGLWIDENNGIPGREVYIYKTNNGLKVIICEAVLGKVSTAAALSGDITVNLYEVGSVAADVKFVVTKDNEIYDTVSALQGQYVAVYAKPGFETAGATADADEYLLVVDALEVVQGTETDPVHVVARVMGPNLKRYDSYVVASTGGRYDYTQETLLLNSTNVDSDVTFTAADGKTLTYLHANNVVQKTRVAPAVLYINKGDVLLIEQTVAAGSGPDEGYAYFYDVKEFPVNTGGGDSSWEWDSDGGSVEPGAQSHARSTFRARLFDANTEKDLDDGTGLGVTIVFSAAAKAAGAPTEVAANSTAYTWSAGLYNSVAKYLGTLVYYQRDTARNCVVITPITGMTLGGLPNGSTKVDPSVRVPGYGSVKVTGMKSEGVAPVATPGDIPAATETNIAFDGATKFIVVKTGINEKGNRDFALGGIEIHDIWEIKDQTHDYAIVTVVGDLAKVNGGSHSLATAGDNFKVIPTKADADPDAEAEIARVVLVVDSGAAPVTQNNQTVFIAGNKNAPKTWVYTDETFTSRIEYYEYWAVIDGNLKKIGIEVDSTAGAGNGAWGILGFAADPTQTLLLTNITTQSFKTYITGDSTIDIITTASLSRYASGYHFLNPDLVVEDIEAISPFRNEHIRVKGLTGDPTKADRETDEDYLLRKNANNVFAFNTEDGTITRVDPNTITETVILNGKYNMSALRSKAVRTSDHKTLNWLFLDVTPVA